MPIPYGASRVHNIYDIDVKNAKTIEHYIDEITGYINEVDIIVGHNIEYDEDMVKLELRRLEKLHAYKPKHSMCTMKTSVDFCAMR